MTANNSNGTKKLLDYWEKPPEAGEPLGCLSTSYTFNAAHFEEQCLARFVGCSTTLEEDDVLFRVDLETRLSQLDAAAVFVDQHKANGIRNLRWDLIPVRVPQGVLHAKLSVLCWRDWIRLIVASANLTPDGYRRNNEIFASIDYYRDAVAPRSLLNSTFEFYRKLMDVYTTVNKERESKILAFLDREKDASSKWNIREPEGGLDYNLGIVWPDKKDKKDNGRFISKKRHIYKDDRGMTWEVDVFSSGVHIIVAEVELPKKNFKLKIPKFIDDVMLLEVTELKQFSNRNLSNKIN